VQKTVLFVGAGRHQRRAILRAKELGLRVVGVDRNPDASGLAVADVVRVVDFDPAAVLKAVRRLRSTACSRSRPTVRCRSSPPSPRLAGCWGSAPRHLMTHKVAMRRELAEAGVPQPRFAGSGRSANGGVRRTRSASRRC
jgi:biotin carboxylase